MTIPKNIAKALGNPGIWAYVKEKYYNEAINYLDKELDEFHDKKRGDIKVKFKDFDYKHEIDACDFSHEKFQDEDVLIGIWRVKKEYLIPDLDDYEDMVKDKDCKFCRREYPSRKISLDGLKVEHYDHDGGWPVRGFAKKQWLYVVCPGCGHQHSFNHLGISKEVKQ